MQAPVTTILKVRPQPGRAAECLDWMQQTAARAATFPGYLGRDLLQSVGADGLLVTIFTFESTEALQAWETSPARAEQVALGQALVAELIAKQQLTGLEFMARDERPLVRWKLVLLTIAVIFFLLNTLVPGLQALFVLLHLPALLKSLLGVAIMVSLMTYLIMPRIGKWLGAWLRQA